MPYTLCIYGLWGGGIWGETYTCLESEGLALLYLCRAYTTATLMIRSRGWMQRYLKTFRSIISTSKIKLNTKWFACLSCPFNLAGTLFRWCLGWQGLLPPVLARIVDRQQTPPSVLGDTYTLNGLEWVKSSWLNQVGARKFLYFQQSGLGGRKNSDGLFLQMSVLVHTCIVQYRCRERRI